jgi:voltage-gated potassium channel
MTLIADDLASRRPAPQWRFLQLTLVMFAWMIVYPRLERAWLAQLVLQIVMLDVMLVTLWANPAWVRLRRIMVGLLLLSVVASVIENLDLPQAWIRVNATTQGVLHLPIMAACVAGVLTFVFRSERPTLDGVFATVVAYLLVAMMFAQVYGIALVWNPDALHLGSPLDQLTSQARDGQLLYFSIVTLATLGYGDLLPTSEITRMLAAIEAIVGQFYVAVIVAVLVGMYATQALEERSSRRTEARRDD